MKILESQHANVCYNSYCKGTKGRAKGNPMQIFKANINGNEYEFICEFKDTRSGFNHTCKLFVNDRFETSATCHYINRTWESYNYQSVMLRAVGILMEQHENFLKEIFKSENGYEKMTAKRKEEFNRHLAVDNMMMEYQAVKEKLHKGFRD